MIEVFLSDSLLCSRCCFVSVMLAFSCDLFCASESKILRCSKMFAVSDKELSIFSKIMGSIYSTVHFDTVSSSSALYPESMVTLIFNFTVQICF